jgi:nucleoside-diphosphate-sugar epimerase
MIVGATGYLGPVIAQAIRDRLNPEVLAGIDTSWFTAAALAPYEAPFSSITKVDKRRVDVEMMKGFDVVIDLAAVSNDPMGADFVDATFDINFVAAVDLAKRARQAGVRRFIFASSCSIYGAAGDGARSEDDKKDPLTAYAKSKWQSEVELAKLGDESFSPIALRFATACGWSPTFRADLVLNDFVVTAITEGKITVLSDGTPWRPLVHTKDIGRAVAWAAQADIKGFAAFNVGSNAWTLTIAELAKSVSDILGVPYEITGAKNADKRSYRVSFDKFEAVAKGWLPQERVESAVKEMKDELSKYASRLVDFRKGNLIRLNVLRGKIAGGELDRHLVVQNRGA